MTLKTFIQSVTFSRALICSPIFMSSASTSHPRRDSSIHYFNIYSKKEKQNNYLPIEEINEENQRQTVINFFPFLNTLTLYSASIKLFIVNVQFLFRFGKYKLVQFQKSLIF